MIPKISDERLVELHKKIKPVVSLAVGKYGPFPHSQGYLHYLPEVSVPDLQTCSLLDAMRIYKPENPQGETAVGLREFARINTYHKDTAGKFTPRIKEVLAQIRDSGFLDRVVAYQIMPPEWRPEISNIVEKLPNNYYKATLILYCLE